MPQSNTSTVEQTLLIYDKAAVSAAGLEAGPSMTDGLVLEGAHNWTPTMFIRLVQDLGVDTQVAQHLSATYGDRAFSVGKMAQLTGMRWPIVGKRIAGDLPVGRGRHVAYS